MSTAQYWYLEEVNLFKLLCPHRFAEFRQAHSFKAYQKGDFIYLPQEQAARVYLIAEGKVKIGYYTPDGEEVVKAILSKGEIFGEMALLGEQARDEFAQAQESRTTICPLSIDQMHDLMRANRQLSLYVYKWMGLRIKKLERRLDLLTFKDVRTRVVEFIRDLAREQGQSVKGGILIKHHFTQKDMADLVGSKRQTVATLLNQMAQNGQLELKRGLLLIKQPQAFGMA
ncbi:MAG: Crp/Fnr family transcriptional regulator [Bernardetiaceae bacterium]|jgi:CRP-like cAMP-binding protein|nr:Crp/Fnr family transcriptional regulator [Bernardetiaceae bacterium]